MSNPETKLLAVSNSLAPIFAVFFVLGGSVWLYQNWTPGSLLRRASENVAPDSSFTWQQPIGVDWGQPADWNQTKPINLEYTKGLSEAVVPASSGSGTISSTTP